MPGREGVRDRGVELLEEEEDALARHLAVEEDAVAHLLDGGGGVVVVAVVVVVVGAGAGAAARPHRPSGRHTVGWRHTPSAPQAWPPRDTDSAPGAKRREF